MLLVSSCFLLDRTYFLVFMTDFLHTLHAKLPNLEVFEEGGALSSGEMD